MSRVLALLALSMAACSDSPSEPAHAWAASVVGSGLSEIPIYEVWEGTTCDTDVPQTWTLAGTARIQQRGDLYVLVGSGTVTTTDGYYGTFNRTFVFKGDQVVHLRFHDMEISSSTGTRGVFSLGMYHSTAPDGTSVVEFEKYGGMICR